MDRLTVWMILYVFISGLQATYGEGCIEQTGSANVCCKLLTVTNGIVCYAWFWPDNNGMKTFAWSSAKLNCNPGYVLSSSQYMLLCERNDITCGTCDICHSWNGSFPECQKQETNKTTTTTTTTTTTFTTTIYANSNTSPLDTTATTTSTTKQTETMTTLTRTREKVEGSTNLSSAGQPSSTPVTVETSSQNISNSTPKSTNNSEPFISPDEDGHNLLPLYIAVPTVIAVVLVMLVVLLVICRRKHQKQTNDDPYNNRHTGPRNSGYKLHPQRPADYNVVNDHMDGKPSKGYENYDHLGISARVKYENLYSHTFQATDADTYSSTTTSAQTSADKTQSTGKGKAVIHAEQTYDTANYPMAQSVKRYDNYSDVTNIGPELNATAPIEHADAAEETNLYSVVSKKTK